MNGYAPETCGQNTHNIHFFGSLTNKRNLKQAMFMFCLTSKESPESERVWGGLCKGVAYIAPKSFEKSRDWKLKMAYNAPKFDGLTGLFYQFFSFFFVFGLTLSRNQSDFESRKVAYIAPNYADKYIIIPLFLF